MHLADFILRFLRKVVFELRQPFMVCRWVVIALAIIAMVRLLNQILSPDEFLNRDLNQNILMGLALRSSIDPYIPVPDLSAMFFEEFNPDVNPHPSPHPPFVAVTFTIFSWLQPSTTYWVWFLLSLLALSATIYLSIRESKKGRLTESPQSLRFPISGVLCIVAFFSLSNSVKQELYFGQIQLVMLPFVVLFFSRLRLNADLLAGFVLGGLLSFKLFSPYFLPVLLLYGRFKVLSWTFVSIVLFHLPGIYLLGLDSIIRFYSEIAAYVAIKWAAIPYNFGFFGVPFKLVLATSIFNISELITRPAAVTIVHLEQAPWLPVTAQVLSAFAVALLMLRCYVDKCLEVSLRRTLLFATVFSPIAWEHIFVFLIPLLIWLFLEFELDQASGTGWPGIFLVVTLIFLIFLPLSRLILWEWTSGLEGGLLEIGRVSAELPFWLSIGITVWAAAACFLPRRAYKAPRH